MSFSARETRLAYALLILVPTMWSMNYIVARVAPGVIAPHTLALGRWALASAILCVAMHRELWARRAEIQRDWLRYLVLGALGMLVCGAWVYIAGRSTSTMNIALIYAAAPVLILIGSVLWLGERMTGARLAGTVLSLVGVVHVTVKGHWNSLAGVHLSSGDLWIVCATLGWAAYSLLLRIWPSTLSTFARVAVTSFAGSCVLLPFAIWEHSTPGLTAWSRQATLLVVVSALFPGVIAYWAYGRAQQILGSARAATSLYMAPLFAAVAAYVVLGERLEVFHMVGGALVLGGLALATWKRSVASEAV
jgi:drug/metabolite transporter (DMT)-like permease